ncbi:type VI secretion system protein ImpA [Natronocella acetinitrilica]|uniref:Type VI secretion system protein ImpA n=1 Tax=Natronocella acetinitrilica TaxID=414046 RepID=A0AAE3G2Q5_9GAMM|nr:type VI secretion system protein TssA [Natronocella acetinitrilica]MCP1673934.1 type VI secretion system protein ImpA [Natronocella acetinitrilica]
MSLDKYLEPLSEPGPAGVDLYESGEIMTLDMLAKWGSPDDDPDWAELQQACIAALEKSRDLRPATYLAAALLHTQGLRDFCAGISLIRGLLEQHWDVVQPVLDEDGDAMERANAVFNLTHFQKVLKPLRTTALVEDRAAGRFSLQDIELAEGKAEPPAGFDGEIPPLGLIQGALQSMDAELRQSLHDAVKQCVDDIAGIETAFREQVGAEQAPDLARLRDGVKRIHATLSQYATGGGMDDKQPEEAQPDSMQSGSAPAPAAARGAPGDILSRQDAIAAMDRISAYFRANEPSSPVPLLMARAKRLVDMDFLDILQDVAPDAVDQVRRLGGVESEK